MSTDSIRLVPIDHLEKAGLRKPVVTLGTFDGVHRGHQRVIETAVEWAREIGGESAVITFDRHPRSVLDISWQGCITSLEHRLLLFERNGLDCCVLIRFHRRSAEMTAADFAKNVIYEGLGCRRVVLGFDCRFGRKREGSIETFRNLRDENGEPLFEAREVGPHTLDGKKISSTQIRAAIVEGRLARAGELLGRPYSIAGTVIRADARGAKLGYPTANLNLHHEISPPFGVYHTETAIISGPHRGGRFNSITNIGTRPTFEGEALAGRAWVEAHLLDFSGDLYGSRIELIFLRRIRDEIKFSAPAELKRAIAADIDKVRHLYRAQNLETN